MSARLAALNRLEGVGQTMAAPKPEEFGLSEARIDELDKQYWRLRVGVAVLAGLAFLALALNIGYGYVFARSIGDPMFNFYMMAVPLSIFAGLAGGMFFFLIMLSVPLPFWTEQEKLKRYRRELKNAKERDKQSRHNYWSMISGGRLQREVADLYRGLGYDILPPLPGTEQVVDWAMKKEGLTVLVHCRTQRELVDFPPAKFLNDLIKAKKADRALVVSIPGFTPKAKRFATGKQVGLIGVAELANIKRYLEELAKAEAASQVQQA